MPAYKPVASVVYEKNPQPKAAETRERPSFEELVKREAPPALELWKPGEKQAAEKKKEEPKPEAPKQS